MARWRAIHPKISQSLDVEGMSEWAQLLWDRIIANADDWGRMRGEAALVKAQCKPLSPRPVEDFEAALREVEGAGLVRRWQVGRQTYLQIVQWETYHHATGIHQRTKSDYPAPPPETSGNVPGSFPEDDGKLPNHDTTHNNTEPRDMSLPGLSSPSGTQDPPGTTAGAPTDAGASAPAVPPQPAYWETFAEQDANVRTFCEVMHLDTKEQVEAAGAFGVVRRWERTFGRGLVAETLLLLDAKQRGDQPCADVKHAISYCVDRLKAARAADLRAAQARASPIPVRQQSLADRIIERALREAGG